MKTKIIVFFLFATTAGAFGQPLSFPEGTPGHVRQFFERFLPIAYYCSGQYAIPASMILAIAALETGYGTADSPLVQLCYNYFSIKGGACPDCCKKVIEYQNERGERVRVKLDACFLRFERPEDSFLAFCGLITEQHRYRNLRSIARWDYRRWANRLKAAGYATDPDYARKLIRIVERYALYRYDPLPAPHPYWPEGIPFVQKNPLPDRR